MGAIIQMYFINILLKRLQHEVIAFNDSETKKYQFENELVKSKGTILKKSTAISIYLLVMKYRYKNKLHKQLWSHLFHSMTSQDR